MPICESYNKRDDKSSHCSIVKENTLRVVNVHQTQGVFPKLVKRNTFERVDTAFNLGFRLKHKKAGAICSGLIL